MKIKEAAQKLGKSEQFVRVGLQQGILPFGAAVKMKRRYSYHVSPEALKSYLSGGQARRLSDD